MFWQNQNKDLGTEWDAIQRRLGNLPPEEESSEEEELDYSHLLKDKSERIKEELVSSNATYEQAKEREDEVDDDAFFQEYRRKRMAELQAKAQKEIYGELLSISEPEYKDVVNTKDTWVVVLLYKLSLPTCQQVDQYLQKLASKFRATRFVKIYSVEAIKNYPDKNLPTLLIYHSGDLKTQFVGLGALGGSNLDANDIEWRLKTAGAVESDMDEDPSRKKKGPSVRFNYVAPRSRPTDDDDDDRHHDRDEDEDDEDY